MSDAANSPDSLPRLAITMGDPAGVGPEIIAAAWLDPQLHAACVPLVLGDSEVMRRAVALRCGGSVQVVSITEPREADALGPASLGCLTPPRANAGAADSAAAADVPPGVVDPRAGAAAYDAIVAAARLALAGEIDGLVTAPINKKSLREAGIDFPGHTELLAEMCGAREFAMMLYQPAGPDNSHGLGVAHVTLHVALRDVFELLTPFAIIEKAKLLDAMLRDLRDEQDAPQDPPRLGVAALNPHGGESGLFGQEEIELIAPAVAAARATGLNVHGPIPADTLFRHAAAGAFDGVVAMYHDQGHIALKLLGMHQSVNVTLGLPIVRTSVAHGTAFDIAWQGKAAPDSLLQAVDVAARLAGARQRAQV